MIRRRQVQPDAVLETETYGEIPHISYAALLEAMVQLAGTLDLAGGYAAVVLDRHPTDTPSEMVTVGAIIEWKDRTTDARPAPERSVAATPVPASESPSRPVDTDAAHAEMERMHFPDADEPPKDNPPPEPDGLDPSTLDEEDVSSIDNPELVR
jgi:hypothetical protein